MKGCLLNVSRLKDAKDWSLLVETFSREEKTHNKLYIVDKQMITTHVHSLTCSGLMQPSIFPLFNFLLQSPQSKAFPGLLWFCRLGLPSCREG
jgi:hypothetical protein